MVWRRAVQRQGTRRGGQRRPGDAHLPCQGGGGRCAGTGAGGHGVCAAGGAVAGGAKGAQAAHQCTAPGRAAYGGVGVRRGGGHGALTAHRDRRGRWQRGGGAWRAGARHAGGGDGRACAGARAEG